MDCLANTGTTAASIVAAAVLLLVVGALVLLVVRRRREVERGGSAAVLTITLVAGLAGLGVLQPAPAHADESLCPPSAQSTPAAPSTPTPSVTSEPTQTPGPTPTPTPTVEPTQSPEPTPTVEPTPTPTPTVEPTPTPTPTPEPAFDLAVTLGPIGTQPPAPRAWVLVTVSNLGEVDGPASLVIEVPAAGDGFWDFGGVYSARGDAPYPNPGVVDTDVSVDTTDPALTRITLPGTLTAGEEYQLFLRPVFPDPDRWAGIPRPGDPDLCSWERPPSSASVALDPSIQDDDLSNNAATISIPGTVECIPEP